MVSSFEYVLNGASGSHGDTRRQAATRREHAFCAVLPALGLSNVHTRGGIGSWAMDDVYHCSAQPVVGVHTHRLETYQHDTQDNSTRKRMRVLLESQRSTSHETRGARKCHAAWSPVSGHLGCWQAGLSKLSSRNHPGGHILRASHTCGRP